MLTNQLVISMLDTVQYSTLHGFSAVGSTSFFRIFQHYFWQCPLCDRYLKSVVFQELSLPPWQCPLCYTNDISEAGSTRVLTASEKGRCWT